MKAPIILHTSDLHIGACRGFPNYLDRYAIMLEEIIEVAKRKKVDMILIVGDLFEHKVVKEQERNLATKWMFELDKLGIPVILSCGNHDVIDPFLSTLQIFKVIEIQGRYNNVKIATSDSETLSYPEMDLEVLSVPDCNSKGFSKSVINFSNDTEAKYNILMTHGIFKGASVDTGFSFDHGRDINKTKIKQAWKKLTYVALGDIHKYQRVKKRTYYCGSPIQHNFGEVPPKGVIVVSLEEPDEPRLVKLKKPKKFYALNEPPADGIFPDGYVSLKCEKSKMPDYLPDNVIKTRVEVPGIKEQIKHTLDHVDLANGLVEFMAEQGLSKEEQTEGQQIMSNLISRINK